MTRGGIIMSTLIAVDHGNKQIKTSNHVFVSGVATSKTKPPFGEYILMGDTYYVLQNKRQTYLKDKTQNETYFVLTLFAIVKELSQTEQENTDSIIDIVLAVGLPPKHFSSAPKFKSYFLKQGEPLENGSKIVNFEYKGKIYSICISNVEVFPQAYAAAIYKFEMVRQIKRALIIDIGGFTLDYLLLTNGQPDTSTCDSLDSGIITLYNRIKSEANNVFNCLLEEGDIDDIIMGSTSIQYDEDVIRLVERESQKFVDVLIQVLRERLIDLHTVKTIFVGGGSILLNSFIKGHKEVGEYAMIDDIKSNVEGYAVLYRLQHQNI